MNAIGCFTYNINQFSACLKDTYLLNRRVQNFWTKSYYRYIPIKCTQMMSMSLTFFTISKVPFAWQLPWRKWPHEPLGFPKLAKWMRSMFWPPGHSSTTSEDRSVPTFLERLLTQDWTGGGCDSEMWPQTVSTDLVTTDTFDRSPPISSSRTNEFVVGFNQARGIWYLHLATMVFWDLNNNESDGNWRVLWWTTFIMVPRIHNLYRQKFQDM